MIAAGEFRRVPFVGRHDERAAMSALVVDHAHASFLVPHQNDRLASHARREIVAGLFDLAFVPNIEPSHAEDAFHLQFEDGGVGIDATVDAAGRNQARKLSINVAHGVVSWPPAAGRRPPCAVPPDPIPNDTASWREPRR